MWSADCGSDHRQLHFPRRPLTSKRVRFDVSLLQAAPAMSAEQWRAVSTRVASYQAFVASGLQPVTGDLREASVEEQWHVICDSLQKAGNQHLGLAKRQPDWFAEN